jgi:DNA polymerase-3 subunit epsilon
MATHLERTHLLEELLAGVKKAVAALPVGKRGRPSRACRGDRAEETPDRHRLVADGESRRRGPRRGAGGTAARKGVALACDLGPTILRCDGFAVTRLLERLALDWTGDGAQDLALTLAADGSGGGRAQPRGSWQRWTMDAVANWLAMPLSPGMTGFTGAAVCTAHGMTVTSEPAGPGRAALALSPCRWRNPTRPAPPARCSTISTC